MHTVYLSLGSNLGDRHALLEQAIRLLGQRVGVVDATSTFIETEPWGFESEHPFLNAAVRLTTSLTPFQLLLTTQQIERELGRTHKSTPATAIPAATATLASPAASATVPDDSSSEQPLYHDRTIDIDILLYGEESNTQFQSIHLSGIYAVDGQLLSITIPHPLMHERDFVMIPLRQITQKVSTTNVGSFSEFVP